MGVTVKLRALERVAAQKTDTLTIQRVIPACGAIKNALVMPNSETTVVHKEKRLSPGKAISRDRKSTRLNSSHGYISYAVFCLKKKNKHPAYAIRAGRIRSQCAQSVWHGGGGSRSRVRDLVLSPPTVLRGALCALLSVWLRTRL